MHLNSYLIRTLSIGTLLCGLIAQGPAAEAASKSGQSMQDWQMRCDQIDAKTKREQCHISQNISLKDGGTVMQVAIGYLPGKTKPAALITLPLGVLLPPGIVIEIDNKKVKKLSFERCDQGGCVVGFVVDDVLLKWMGAGQTMHVNFSDSKHQKLRVPCSLLGFNAGMRTLKAQQP